MRNSSLLSSHFTIVLSLRDSFGLYVHDLAISCALRDDSSLLQAIKRHACAILYWI